MVRTFCVKSKSRAGQVVGCGSEYQLASFRQGHIVGYLVVVMSAKLSKSRGDTQAQEIITTACYSSFNGRGLGGWALGQIAVQLRTMGVKYRSRFRSKFQMYESYSHIVVSRYPRRPPGDSN